MKMTKETKKIMEDDSVIVQYPPPVYVFQSCRSPGDSFFDIERKRSGPIEEVVRHSFPRCRSEEM